MKLNCDVPLPITFNCWKHHLGFIKDRTKKSKDVEFSDSDFKKVLLVIGESQMDLYLGNMSPVQIGNEIIDLLKNKKVIGNKSYIEWLFEKGEKYKLISISDSSIWTLRLGQDKEKYLHIHPGRQSPLTIRIKAHTLKTAIAVTIQAKKTGATLTDLNFINTVRKNFINLPPLKSISSLSGLGKFMNILNN